MEQLSHQVAQLLNDEPALLPAQIAERLGVSEFAVVSAFPSEMVTLLSGDDAQMVLTEIADWGTNVTTIVQSFGSIFEIKAPLPKGKMARGYYNLLGQPGQLHGHLKLELIDHVALVSKPFMGRESHYFGFFTQQGDSIFKIYLGRDDKRELIAQQVDRFQTMQQQFK
ncbi:hutX protein [Vibrio metschnikovii]|jgi:putative heme utilization carrier protein HutX|uniref:heme utilization cystosolic carrier protein HutX n=1 Tax=Vibrio metschnikovii TaxID=28172 RepID=UPI0001B93AC9|nr:heme utilization cystosolic carrier protein HutX [Vibrio metschnikovii]EEX36094.1 putative heme iron utilization protein [Vibrio metschnikovii CIP 69.14]EKO3605360.1 heme utilization cystosolic carrier protein HutX [Vibrio metschnikovii]EKO3713154.1 heme utilization cystosolic carrier protein HutX [Vibrio metschnikovii]EKO3732012.1 heme utilization cystosolic carrier protein HutX [Vibrio metschnikovii]EKO3738171.1 heme utilization cystosolic carrier protein HutX [Vibrio metschnikovii]